MASARGALGGQAAATTWEGDRWLDDEWLPFIDALAQALRAQPGWEAQGFRAVRVLSFAGWHHLMGSEASLGLFEPSTVEDTKIVLLTRTLPPPDGRTYYGAVPVPDDVLMAGEEHGWLAETLLRQAVEADPRASPGAVGPARTRTRRRRR